MRFFSSFCALTLAVIFGADHFAYAQNQPAAGSPAASAPATAAQPRDIKPFATFALEKIMTPPAQGDIVLGKADAPITIVEYASLTCGHCAAFHDVSMPHLKKNYIETGKVKFIFREYPLDDRAMGASMVLRCAYKDTYHAALDLLFRTQGTWARSQEWREDIKKILRPTGVPAEKVEACFRDPASFASISNASKAAYDGLQVRSTPTFFINGAGYAGALTPADLDRLLAPLLSKP